MPVVFGLVTAYLLTPVLNFIETKLLFPLCRKMKVKESRKRNSIVRGIGILITAFLFVTLIYSLVAMMLSQIVPSIVNIASNFDTYISNFTKWISKLMDDNPELGSQITFLIDKYSVELENWLNNTVLTLSLIHIFTFKRCCIFCVCENICESRCTAGRGSSRCTCLCRRCN